MLQKSGQDAKDPQEDTASAHTADMPNGNHLPSEAEAAIEAEDDEISEAEEVRRQVLLKAGPLAGVWGLDRFGLTDITVLKLLEALPGMTAPTFFYKFCMLFHE